MLNATGVSWHPVLNLSIEFRSQVVASSAYVDGQGMLWVQLNPYQNGVVAWNLLIVSETFNFEQVLCRLEVLVVPVNDAPSFRILPSASVLEDSGLNQLAGFASNISAGPGNERTQEISFILTAASPGSSSVFVHGPLLHADGSLEFQTAVNYYGETRWNATLVDNGGTSNGGRNTSDMESFVIVVLPVNDVPTFRIQRQIRIPSTQDLLHIPNVTYDISAGAYNEMNQKLTFN
eukprot:759568-Hanusia_phi.AAC.1